MPIAHPYRVDRTGRTATSDGDPHVVEMIEAVLFTAPGERVRRPDFGTGVHQLTFAPASPEMATATQQLVRGALQAWLSDVILVEGVKVSAEDGVLSVTVQYRVRRSDRRETATFTREV